MTNINDLPTQYIITDDNYVGVIIGQTKTQIIVCLPWKSEVKFMKVSKRQVGTPKRTFRYVRNTNELENVK